MKIIIDSGSTKTDWLAVSLNGEKKMVKTEGVNPILQDAEDIRIIFDKALTTIGKKEQVEGIYYYGAGIRDEYREKIVLLLLQSANNILLVSKDITICIESDLLGSARALLGNKEGIACILGTGSNSCIYDGTKIIDNIPPLGYILGDEGSGAVLGKSFIEAMYKRQLPNEIKNDFEQEFNTNISDIINRTYRQPMPNRFLASISPFIHKHINNKDVERLVIDHFSKFIRYCVLPYKRTDLSLNCIGSIAYYYQNELCKAAEEHKITLGKIEKSPLKGLESFHENLKQT